jgi:hypothetical protein
MDNIKKVKKLVDFQSKHYGYKIVFNDVIIDGKTTNRGISFTVPEDIIDVRDSTDSRILNRHHKIMLEWLEADEGNTIEEAG